MCDVITIITIIEACIPQAFIKPHN